MSLLTRYAYNALYSLDQFFNTITGGDPDETISSRVGKLRRAHHDRIPLHHPLAKLIDWVCDGVDHDHTLESIEDDEGNRAVWPDHPKPRKRIRKGKRSHHPPLPPLF